MNRTTDPPLNGFEARLLEELRVLVELRAATQRPISSRTQARRTSVARRPYLAAAAVALGVACAVALIGLTGSTPTLAQAFPILARPATVISHDPLASILREQGATLRNARLDVKHARAFSTPWGTGYVVTDTHLNIMCVAAPGLPAGNWGADCLAASQAEREGAGGLLLYGPIGQVSYVEILPKDATATLRDPSEPRRPLPLPNGVLAIVVHQPTVLTVDIAGHTDTVTIRPPLRSARVPVPARAQVAATVQLRIVPARGYDAMTASFLTRYPVRAGRSAYVLEYAPLPGTHPRCRGSQAAGETIDQQTDRNIPAGTRLTLRGGAPDCAGLWRVAVYFAASRGDVHYPGQVWAEPLGEGSTPPPQSGDQIVATQTITIR